ncbi:winged helix-turn-helix transcriptional regulator [Aureimonas mangrovi]|uniref:winged helix-turn-helix transcriptional regulator n=1 Tax=Aureimonas mangrovi TaxID=2758041 RepID=UPI00163DA062|nr:winged helix-turn-helix transcriptional regulator [Aureimonas mangrovi]
MKLEKITEERKGPKRLYEDACGAAHALDILGERWALLVVRELMFGPKRFGDIRAGLPGISANVLTQRLEGLEAAGVLFRRTLPPPGAVKVYELTPWGLEAEPIFQTLGRWASRSPFHDPTLSFSAASLMLSMRTMIAAERAAGIEAKVGFRPGAEGFLARLQDGGITIERADPEGADVVYTAASPVMAAAIYGGQALSDLEAAGALSIEGDRALAERFVTLFVLPPKAEFQPGKS